TGNRVRMSPPHSQTESGMLTSRGSFGGSEERRGKKYSRVSFDRSKANAGRHECTRRHVRRAVESVAPQPHVSRLRGHMAARKRQSRPPVRRPNQPLEGRVAVVAGATRGAGRGIARALGEAGATVYCTGRSVPGNLSAYGRPETIQETADLIKAAGGIAIPVRVDHTIESEVEAFFARIDREQGRVDVLVNSIAGEEPMMAQWNSFWETNLKNGEAVFRQSLLSHII